MRVKYLAGSERIIFNILYTQEWCWYCSEGSVIIITVKQQRPNLMFYSVTNVTL